jgi:hypothetical protein
MKVWKSDGTLDDTDGVGEILLMEGSFESACPPTAFRGIDFGVGGRALLAEGNGLAFPLVIVSLFGGTGSAFENRERPEPVLSCHVSSIF